MTTPATARQIVEAWDEDRDCPDGHVICGQDCLVKRIQRAIDAERERWIRLCLNPYGDDVQVIGREEPIAVGKKIVAAALRAPEAP